MTILDTRTGEKVSGVSWLGLSWVRKWFPPKFPGDMEYGYQHWGPGDFRIVSKNDEDGVCR